MSVQRLNAKKTRWVAETTGLDVRRAWARGGYNYYFVAACNPRHRHGVINQVSREWEWDDTSPHATTCYTELFPGETYWEPTRLPKLPPAPPRPPKIIRKGVTGVDELASPDIRPPSDFAIGIDRPE